MENLEPLANEAKAAIAAAVDGAALEQLRVDYLGKKGQITGLLKGLGKLSAEERPKAGALINVVKQELQELIGARKTALDSRGGGSTVGGRGHRCHPAWARTVHRRYPIRSPAPWNAWRIFSAPLALMWWRGRRSRTITTTSKALNIPAHHPGAGHARYLLRG